MQWPARLAFYQRGHCDRSSFELDLVHAHEVKRFYPDRTRPFQRRTKRHIDKTEDYGNVEVSSNRATAQDIRQARAVDPENTRKLLAQVRKDSEPPYGRNRCGSAAILKGKK